MKDQFYCFPERWFVLVPFQGCHIIPLSLYMYVSPPIHYAFLKSTITKPINILCHFRLKSDFSIEAAIAQFQVSISRAAAVSNAVGGALRQDAKEGWGRGAGELSKTEWKTHTMNCWR